MEQCFPAPILTQFLAGDLPAPAAAAVRTHVSGCTTCQAELDRLSDNPALESWGSALLKQGPAPAEGPGLRRALEALRAAAADTPPPHPGRPQPFLGPSPHAADLGTLGPYRVLEELGRGGMGIVYRAQDTTLGRPVALKVLQPSYMADPTARQRFFREAQAAAALRHDHVVVIYQVGEQGETLFLAMEFLEGQTLGDRLDRHGALPLREAFRFAREAADGLAAAHRAGLVHRDIKPDNLWIENRPGRSPSTRLKILDFGLALPMEPAVALTKTGLVVGTPDYMSPEQAGGQSVDHRSDLFSLGCVLYHMTTGVAPFTGDNSRAVLRAVLFETPKPPGELRQDAPPALVQLIGWLLAKDPKDRPQSADAVVEALRVLEAALPSPAAAAGSDTEDRAASGAGATPATGTRRTHSMPALRRQRRRLVLAAGLGLVLLGVAGALFLPALSQLFQPAGDLPSPEAGTKPAAPADPFVLQALGDRPERVFPTLAAAVTAAASGDAIAVRGDGPFLCDPIEIGPKDLILRAALGSRPRLQHGRPEARIRGPLLVTSRNLVLEGLEFQCFGEGSNPEPALVWCTPPGTLHAAQCRFLMQGDGVAVRSASAALQIRRCAFLLSDRTWWGVHWRPLRFPDALPSHATVEGCLFYNPNSGCGCGLYLNYSPPFPTYSLDVSSNTFATTQSLGVRFGKCSKEDVLAAGRTGRIQLSANLFAAQLSIVDHFTLPEWQILPASEAVDLYPAIFDWKDRGNAYASGVPLLLARDQPNPQTPQRTIKSLADWWKWMGVTDTSSVQGGISFRGLSGLETDLDRIHPAQFRLADGGAGRKAGPGGRDLGADVDAVGPGAAYEAWLKTAAYQQWLKNTGR